MGGGQSKRSVDITAPSKDGVKEVAGDEQIPVEGKMEKIEDTVKPATNGSSHSEPETKAVEEVVANGGDLKDKIVAAAEPEALTSPDIEPASPENETPEADTNNKSKKALKVKKKWSFRSISFSKKDKKKPNKEEGAATKDGTEATTELIEEKPEGAAGLLASVTGADEQAKAVQRHAEEFLTAVTGNIDEGVAGVHRQVEEIMPAVTGSASEEVAAVHRQVEAIIAPVIGNVDDFVVAQTKNVEVVAASITEKILGAKEEVVAEADSAKAAAVEAVKEEIKAVDEKVDKVKVQVVATKSEIEKTATEVCDVVSNELAAATTEIIAKTDELVKKVEEIPPPLPACPPPNEIIASMVSQAEEQVTVENTEALAEKASIQVPCISVQPASPIPATAGFEEVTKVVDDVLASGEKVMEQVAQEITELESFNMQCVESVEEKSPIIDISETLAETQVVTETPAASEQASVEQ